MKNILGNLMVSADYLNATVTVSLLSVLVLIFLFLYLNWYTGRRYFSLWTLGWVFYALWLWTGPGITGVSPFMVMLKHWCVGLSAALLLWGSAQLLKMPPRPMLVGLFMGFLLVWSYVGAYHLKDPLQIRAPIFAVIGLASLLTAFSFYRVRKHLEYLGAGLLTFGFALWGLYLGLCPFFAGNGEAAGTGFLISAVLQLFIAVSMIILVLEEARAANELILAQIRACQSEALSLEAPSPEDEDQYQGVFNRTNLGKKLIAARNDLRRAQESSLQRERLQALAQMSRGMAHDINNALTPILGYSNLLLREVKGLPPDVVQYLKSIKNAGEKISQSVACIRDFYRSRQGRDLLVALDLNPIVDEAIEESRRHWQKLPQSELLKSKIDVQLESSLPRIMGQSEELREAIKELVINGLEAMPESGTCRLRTGLRPAANTNATGHDAGHVFVEISDEGVGMDEDTRKRCLEPFFTTKHRHGAKGLGLSKVFGTTQRCEAEIEIETRPGRGTRIRLVFPAVHSGSTEMIYPAHKLPAQRPLKILCIDDEPAVLDVMKIILNGNGHRVAVAPDGFRGLGEFREANARREPFDVVLTDLGMPQMDGHQIALAVKRESPNTPVIMLTGWGDIMQAENNHPQNVDAVLSKPPQANDIFRALHKVTTPANPQN
jgi:signal transduction histidine kinase/ActR/RegA family two-component response regulator